MVSSVGWSTWSRSLSAWQSLQLQRQRQQEMAAQFMSDASTISSALTSAWSDQISGTATLAAQAAADRINAATALAKSAASSIDTTI